MKGVVRSRRNGPLPVSRLKNQKCPRFSKRRQCSFFTWFETIFHMIFFFKFSKMSSIYLENYSYVDWIEYIFPNVKKIVLNHMKKLQIPLFFKKNRDIFVFFLSYFDKIFQNCILDFKKKCPRFFKQMREIILMC